MIDVSPVVDRPVEWNPSPTGAYWYRYEDRRTAGYVDECGDSLPGSGSLEVRLWRYPVLKETPRGVRLGGGASLTGDPKGRFVNREATKMFACPTEGCARKCFLARKRRQAAIYRARLRDAEAAIRMAESGEFRNDPI